MQLLFKFRTDIVFICAFQILQTDEHCVTDLMFHKDIFVFFYSSESFAKSNFLYIHRYELQNVSLFSYPYEEIAGNVFL